MPGWRTWLTLALLAAAGISGWSILNHRAPQPVRAPVDSRSDYQLFDFELVALDENGNEAFTLRAPQLARRPGDESMDLATPLFLFPVSGEDGSGPERWQMRSDTAWVSPGGEEVRLAGNVEADGPGTGSDAATLRTESLSVFPADERASSDVRVTMRSGGSIIQSGRGLRMDLAKKRYQLLDDVEFRYAPNR